ncbi:MAG: S41 family peptidase [Chlamydiota bacterium]
MLQRVFSAIYLIFGVSFLSQGLLEARKASLISTEEIPTVMEKFFRYHVEKKALDGEIVRRCFAIYIDQFDPERIYLLEEERALYASMSRQRAAKIAKNMARGNFSVFYAMDDLIKTAIKRSKKIRKGASGWMSDPTFYDVDVREKQTYARNERELKERLKGKLMRFYLHHQRHTKIDTPERREQLALFFLMKLQERENPYYALDLQGNLLDPRMHEHQFSVRILKAFAKSLDAHSSYFSPEEAKELRFHLEKQFEGFGIVLGESIDGVFIAKIIPGSPAEQQGILQEKDLIIELDGKPADELTLTGVLAHLKQRDKPSIELGIERREEGADIETFYVTLEKAPIVMDQERISLKYSPFGSGIIGCITLRAFYDNGGDVTSEMDIKKALLTLRSQGELKGLVLDLRENGGGFLSQAVKVAALFIKSGVVVISKYGQNEIHYLRSIDPRASYHGPLLVLTSKISASASEIVAQALQDYGVALVVGDVRTFGKGSIQYQTITSDDPDIYFKVTIGKYYTVSGRTTQMRGVIADIVIPTSFAPFQLGEEYLQHPLKADKVSPAYEDSLADVDPHVRGWLEANYLPYLQEKMDMYHAMLPYLRKNSKARIQKNPSYQAFLQNQENIKKRIEGDPNVSVDLLRNFGLEDLQMEEAINVLRDIIYLQSKQSLDTSAEQEHLKNAS